MSQVKEKSSKTERSTSCKRRKSQLNLFEDQVESFFETPTANSEDNNSPRLPPVYSTPQYSSSVQCRPMPVAMHIALFVLFTTSFAYNLVDEIAKHRVVLTNWLYLTHWNLNFQIFFCAIELLSDLLPSFADKTSALRAKLFHSIVFPFGMFVGCFFWGLCLYDEQLVRHKRPEERYENWYNHVVVSTTKMISTF